MSSPISTHGYQNLNPTAGYPNDDDEHLRASNSDQMFNALMDQYLSTASPTASAAYGYPLCSHRIDPQSGQPFQRVTSPSVGHAQASPGYGSHNGARQATPLIPGSDAYLHGGGQPSFSDLMRELSHEQSRALYVFLYCAFGTFLDG
jgi:hypothetical protein